MKHTLYRIFMAVLAFVVGVLTMPLAAILWPFVATLGMWLESDDLDYGEDGK